MVQPDLEGGWGVKLGQSFWHFAIDMKTPKCQSKTRKRGGNVGEKGKKFNQHVVVVGERR